MRKKTGPGWKCKTARTCCFARCRTVPSPARAALRFRCFRQRCLAPSTASSSGRGRTAVGSAMSRLCTAARPSGFRTRSRTGVASASLRLRCPGAGAEASERPEDCRTGRPDPAPQWPVDRPGANRHPAHGNGPGADGHRRTGLHRAFCVTRKEAPLPSRITSACGGAGRAVPSCRGRGETAG
jgi:hypothetical protein